MLLFDKAIVRRPSQSLIEGISTGMFSNETPQYDEAVKQHSEYVEALESLGLEVLVLDALEEFPDSCFVEDPAVVMNECAIIGHSPRESRHGERFEILGAIKQYYSDDQIYFIEAPGFLEGGDVMQVGKHFYIGLSDRTNQAGADQFNEIVSRFGYSTTTVPVTEGLHLKDFVISLENNQLLVSSKMNQEEAFQSFNRHVVDADELYAINSLLINGTVLVPAGHPKTHAYIESLGYPVIEINTDEFKKIDGSLTCLSLRFIA